jgi:hypothetical protein
MRDKHISVLPYLIGILFVLVSFFVMNAKADETLTCNISINVGWNRGSWLHPNYQFSQATDSRLSRTFSLASLKDANRGPALDKSVWVKSVPNAAGETTSLGVGSDPLGLLSGNVQYFIYSAPSKEYPGKQHFSVAFLFVSNSDTRNFDVAPGGYFEFPLYYKDPADVVSLNSFHRPKLIHANLKCTRSQKSENRSTK